jgi:hypothetical protein
MGWVGFVFARLVALTLIVLAIRRLWRSFPRFSALIAALAILVLSAFTVLKSYSPEGVYGFVGEIEPMNNAPDLAPEVYHRDHFWRLSDGKMQDCFGRVCGQSIPYKKTRDGWVLVPKTEQPYWEKLQFSVFGFRLVTHNGSGAFYPRRIIPFARPYWMPDWLQ